MKTHREPGSSSSLVVVVVGCIELSLVVIIPFVPEQDLHACTGGGLVCLVGYNRHVALALAHLHQMEEVDW